MPQKPTLLLRLGLLKNCILRPFVTKRTSTIMDAYMAAKQNGGIYSLSDNPVNGCMIVTVKFKNGYSVLKEFSRGDEIIAIDVLNNAGKHASFADSLVREPGSPYHRSYSNILSTVAELPLQLEVQQ